jgi:hypothetical protein
MLVLIIAIIVVSGLIAYEVLKNKRKQSFSTNVISVKEESKIVVTEESKAKKELILKERSKQKAKQPKKDQKPKAPKLNAKPTTEKSKSKGKQSKTK